MEPESSTGESPKSTRRAPEEARPARHASAPPPSSDADTSPTILAPLADQHTVLEPWRLGEAAPTRVRPLAPDQDQPTLTAPLPPHPDQPTLEQPVAKALEQPTLEQPLAKALEPRTLIEPLLPRPAPAPVVEPAPAVGVEPQVPARPQARPHRKTWRRQAFRSRATDVLQVAVTCLLLFLAFRAMFQTFAVDGPSMAPNFETGQALLVSRVAYWHIEDTPLEGLLPTHPQGSIAYLFGGPERGDVIIFRPPQDSGFEADLIKRVIGLPGDLVAIDNGQVFVNGNRLEEPYIAFPATYTYPGQDLAIQVPDDSYFVLGDNRPVSADSHLGWVVPVRKLVGQAWLLYRPLSRLGLVPRGDVREVPDEPPTSGS